MLVSFSPVPYKYTKANKPVEFFYARTRLCNLGQLANAFQETNFFFHLNVLEQAIKKLVLSDVLTTFASSPSFFSNVYVLGSEEV